MSLWKRFVNAIWQDTSLVRVEDAGVDAEKLRPERPGEEPPILTSPESMLQLILSLSLTYAGGTVFLFDLNIWWGITTAFVGIIAFFDWCNRYPLRVLLSGQDDIVERMRLKEQFSKDEAGEILNGRLGSSYRRLAFARVLRPDHPLRHVLLLVTPTELIIMPVGWESIAIKSYKLYRHDKVSWFPLADAHLQVHAEKAFHRMYPRLRPRHHPNYLPFFFVLTIGTEEREYCLVLQFEVGSMTDTLLAEINDAAPSEPGRIHAEPAGLQVLSSWHVPRRAARSG